MSFRSPLDPTCIAASIADTWLQPILGPGPYRRTADRASDGAIVGEILSPRHGVVRFELLANGGAARYREQVSRRMVDSSPVAGVGDEAMFGGLVDGDEAAVLAARRGDVYASAETVAGPDQLAPIVEALLRAV